MRILFLAHRLPYPPNKGDKIRSFRELAAMSRSHEVDLFSFYDQPEDADYFTDVRRYCRELYAEKVSWPRSRAQALLALALGRPFTPAYFHSPSMAQRIRQALESRHYDLVFAYSSSMAPYLESARHLPRVLDMVDVDSDKWTQFAEHARPPASWLWSAEGRRLAASERLWAKEFSLTLLSTSAEAQIMEQASPGARIEAFENPIDVKFFDPAVVETTPGIRALQPYIIFTGSMDYFPNVDAVTYFYREVFPAIRADIPNARFVIAGRNPSRAVRQLSSDSSVHVTGTVTDVRPYLRGASVAIAPLRVARGVQTKILEAMCMGLPVAASGKAAMALPAGLIREVQVEDDPQRLAAFLIGKLRSPASQPAQTRRAVLDHVSDQHWEAQLEGLLGRAVRFHAIGQEDLSEPPERSSERIEKAVEI
jgi:polysaccharide biosynthesis protein PslH